LFVAAAGLVNGVISVATADQDANLWGAFWGGFVDGAISGLALGAGLATGGVGGFIIAGAGGFVGGFAGSATNQLISYGNINTNAAIISGLKSAGFNMLMYAPLSRLVEGASFSARFMNAMTPSIIGIGMSGHLGTLPFPSTDQLRDLVVGGRIGKSAADLRSPFHKLY